MFRDCHGDLSVYMGKIPCPYIEDGGEKTTRWTEKVGIGGGGRVSGAESGSNPARAAATASAPPLAVAAPPSAQEAFSFMCW
jgi:hypothetical protein